MLQLGVTIACTCQVQARLTDVLRVLHFAALCILKVWTKFLEMNPNKCLNSKFFMHLRILLIAYILCQVAKGDYMKALI